MNPLTDIPNFKHKIVSHWAACVFFSTFDRNLLRGYTLSNEVIILKAQLLITLSTRACSEQSAKPRDQTLLTTAIVATDHDSGCRPLAM